MGGADSEAVYDGRSRPTVLDGQLTDLGSMCLQRPGPVEVGSRAYQAARSGAQESGGMLSAYVLIETEVGKVAHVAEALTKLDGVQLAEDLVGVGPKQQPVLRWRAPPRRRCTPHSGGRHRPTGPPAICHRWGILHLPGRGARFVRPPGSPQRARWPGRSGARVLLRRPGIRRRIAAPKSRRGTAGAYAFPSRFPSGPSSRSSLPVTARRNPVGLLVAGLQRCWCPRTAQNGLSGTATAWRALKVEPAEQAGIAPWRRTAVD
jgi:hypothetical protein